MRPLTLPATLRLSACFCLSAVHLGQCRVRGCCICSSLLECQPSSAIAFSLLILIFDMWFDMNMVFYMWINLGAYTYSVIYKGILFTISYTSVNNFYLVVKLIPSHYDVQSVVLDILMLWYSFYLQPFLEFIFLSRNFQISDFSSLFWPLFALPRYLSFSPPRPVETWPHGRSSRTQWGCPCCPVSEAVTALAVFSLSLWQYCLSCTDMLDSKVARILVEHICHSVHFLLLKINLNICFIDC